MRDFTKTVFDALAGNGEGRISAQLQPSVALTAINNEKNASEELLTVNNVSQSGRRWFWFIRGQFVSKEAKAVV